MRNKDFVLVLSRLDRARGHMTPKNVFGSNLIMTFQKMVTPIFHETRPVDSVSQLLKVVETFPIKQTVHNRRIYVKAIL